MTIHFAQTLLACYILGTLTRFNGWMADNRSLKQELKSWERNFREQNGGRAPTKDDMKKDPAIGKQAHAIMAIHFKP